MIAMPATAAPIATTSLAPYDKDGTEFEVGIDVESNSVGLGDEVGMSFTFFSLKSRKRNWKSDD